MAKHRLTVEQQIAGLRKALRSHKTPKHLKPSIRAYAEKLEAQLSGQKQKPAAA